MADLRAVLIGVSGYTGPLRDFPFATDAVRGLAEVLENHFGYTTTVWRKPGLSGEEIDGYVRQALADATSDTVLIVHVLAHGLQPDSGHLYALGTDRAPVAEVGSWVEAVQLRDGPAVLFLLDMCQSGLIARLPWMDDYSGDRLRAWVLAACAGDESAFNGNFTVALTNVLRDMALGHTAVGAARRYLPLDTLARAARAEVERLRVRQGNWPQLVTGTRLDISEDALDRTAFFWNRPAEGDALSSPVNTRASLSLPGDLDEGLDVAHFLDRATGFSDFANRTGDLIGCFTGRQRQLFLLAPWLATGDETLAVVTGGPGSGKSALLGVLVCAAHPQLSDVTRPLWQNVAMVPPKMSALAVVNCRHRGLDEIAASLGRQLGLPETPAELLAAIGEGTSAQPIVIDALDEAVDPVQIAGWLRSLLGTPLSTGRAAVRLLLATREEPESDGLRELARTSGHLVDLDAVLPEVLETDLYNYISALIKAIPDFDPEGAVTGAFATATARMLAAAGGHGAFLVAGVHTRHFVNGFHRSAHPPGTEHLAAARFGRDVPLDPAEVFAVDLMALTEVPYLRPVLTALAHARGIGMPASVIARVAAVFHPDAEPPDPAQVHAVLNVRGFYVRRSTDTDGVTVYRLFHEELARYLRDTGEAPGLVDALLASLGSADHRVWGAAEPYVLQYALDHASGTPLADSLLTDPGYLLYADPRTVAPALNGRHEKLAALLPEAAPLPERQAAFALAAVKAGEYSLAERIADLPGEIPPAWRPIWFERTSSATAASRGWAVGLLFDRGDLHVWETAGTPHVFRDVSAFALPPGQGDSHLVTGHRNGEVVLRGVGKHVEAELGEAFSMVTSLAAVHDEQRVVVFSGHHGGEIRRSDPHNGDDPADVRPLKHDRPAKMRQVAVGGTAPAAVVCIDDNGVLSAWPQRQFGSEAATRRHAFPPAARPLAVAVGDAGHRTVIVVACADGTVAVFDFATFSLIQPADAPEHPAATVLPIPSWGLALTVLGGRTVAVLGGSRGGVEVFDVLSRRPVLEFTTALGSVSTIAVHRTRTGAYCLVGGSRGAELWELTTQAGADLVRRITDRPVVSSALGNGAGPFAASRPCRVAVHRVGRRSVIVIGLHDGSGRCVDARTGEQVLPPLPHSGEAVLGVDSRLVSDLPVAGLRGLSTYRLWNLMDGSWTLVPWEPPVEQLPGGAHLFVAGELVTAHSDDRGRVLCGDTQLGAHGAAVKTVIGARIDTRAVVVSGADDGSVMMWDVEERSAINRIDVGEPVLGLAHTGDGVLLVVTASGVLAFRHEQGSQVREQ